MVEVINILNCVALSLDFGGKEMMTNLEDKFKELKTNYML